MKVVLNEYKTEAQKFTLMLFIQKVYIKSLNR